VEEEEETTEIDIQEIAEALIHHKLQARKWLTSLPADVLPAFTDNNYVNSLKELNEFLLLKLFSEEELLQIDNLLESQGESLEFYWDFDNEWETVWR